ncbi:hypothetical protein GUITHDRAFT_150215 [Guillardia theta CCMP2712]|uniref:SET domain-containing protein n=1 Tax=Guillardia theta (strain CCMP2712) TaxID=905079 RepID=L1JZB3_GUITC|nr:hypothetical protein GUITHDRAFT_150215 [Guillardia theta CCMP2712]EKX53550.1 hypothetical protein GUITHDRAFT_150215 [Guillardia theta CCMP2712]|eukprot:XP_005840530.1 hypothetical protein GUITHDRAFT_150215 [Guillardia theta CCMP2712]
MPCPPPLLWLNACVISRCFHIWNKDAVMAWMTPFVDMVNHSYDKNCVLATSDNAIEIKTDKAIKKGDEILFSYAHFPNSHFYWRYAFCLEENESDVLEIEGGIRAHQVLFDNFLTTRSPPPPVLQQSIKLKTCPSNVSEEVQEQERTSVQQTMEKIDSLVGACDEFLKTREDKREVCEYVRLRRGLLESCRDLLGGYEKFLSGEGTKE